MQGIAAELLLILALVSLNGVLAMSELALVSARKARLQQRAERGDARARAALALGRDPSRFLSTIQVGITMVGILTGAIGGVTLTRELESFFAGIPLLAPYREPLSFGAVVAGITYLSLILGELVPKRIALNHPESIATLVAIPMRVLSNLVGPVVWLLSQSTETIMRLLRQRPLREEPITDEEIKILVQQAAEAGAFEPVKQNLVERALDFSRLAARHVMVPRTEMIALPHDASLPQVVDVVGRHQHSRYPVYHRSVDDIVGVVSAKQLMPVLAAAMQPNPPGFDLESFVRPPLFVPEQISGYELLARMRAQRTDLAIVVDEFGATSGLVTLRNLLDRIGGEPLEEAEGEGARIQWLPEGAVRVDGLALLSDLADELGIDFGEVEYDTLGGLVFGELGRRPEVGDIVRTRGHTFIVEELDGLRISRVRVTDARTPVNEGRLA